MPTIIMPAAATAATVVRLVSRASRLFLGVWSADLVELGVAMVGSGCAAPFVRAAAGRSGVIV
jgi:hypothetical protein